MNTQFHADSTCDHNAYGLLVCTCGAISDPYMHARMQCVYIHHLLQLWDSSLYTPINIRV